jgi:ABC-type phosphate/phosphonate transport system substrate-binding protein
MQDLRDKVVAHAVLPLTAFTALWIYLSDRTRSFRLGRRCLRPAVLLAALLAAPVLAAEPPPWQMGVLPYLSGERLFEVFLPMKDYLEVQLKRRIVMSTAPDFKTYVQRAARGDYDIYQTAPHFALLAETRDGPGRKFFEANGYGNMGPIADADMARLRPFLKDLKERLK